jgi:hypothetical protein
MSRTRIALATLATLSIAASSGCGGSDTGAGGGDGRYRPAKNGVPVAESTACNTLLAAASSRRTDLACTLTTPTCPAFVRSRNGGEACLQYDEGTISGCAAHYDEAADCEDLSARLDDCVFESIAGSAGAGCE